MSFILVVMYLYGEIKPIGTFPSMDACQQGEAALREGFKKAQGFYPSYGLACLQAEPSK